MYKDKGEKNAKNNVSSREDVHQKFGKVAIS